MVALVIERFMNGDNKYKIGDIVNSDDIPESEMAVLVQRELLMDLDPLLKYLLSQIEKKAPASVK